MSKLNDLIKAASTGKRRAKSTGPLSLMSAWTIETKRLDMPIGQTEHEVGVKLGMRTFIDDDPEAIAKTKKLMAAAIHEELYGEFRTLLMKAFLELQSGDTDQAAETLRSVYERMYPPAL